MTAIPMTVVTAAVGVVSRVVRFFKEAVRELRKAQWPTKAELTGFTVVVVVALAAVATYLAILDIILYRIAPLWGPG